MKTWITAGAAIAAVAFVMSAGSASATQTTPEDASAIPATTNVCRPPSLQDCYTYYTMRAYADRIIPIVENFIKARYRAMPRPSKYVYIGTGEYEDSLCGSDVDSTEYAYCPEDEEIYLGQDTLWLFYSRIGDAAPAVGLAHEWGHHIQQEVGVPEPRTFKQSVRHENQADCIAGAWIRAVINQDILEDDDIGEIAVLIRAIGSAESDTRDHGTVKERAASMLRGLKRGLWGCNKFYPLTPIIAR